MNLIHVLYNYTYWDFALKDFRIFGNGLLLKCFEESYISLKLQNK